MSPGANRLGIGNRAVIALIAVLVLVIVLPLAFIFVRHTQSTSQQRVPQSGLLWGMWIKDADGKADPRAVIANREAALGHRLDVFHWYESWDSSWSNVAPLVDTVDASGRIPMITWEADKRTVSRIAQGRYDSYIDEWARGAAGKKPNQIWVRIFHEFNIPATGGGYSWSIDVNKPADLVAAWRHVHDRFAAAGADNVKWIWNPDGSHSDKIASGFPGDRYVDYTGWDTYGYDNAHDYQVISALSHKPMVIGEFGPGDAPDSSLPAFTKQIADGAYPLLRAVAYFDEGQWSIAGNASAKDALKQMLASRPFKD
jgi:hypothetical protein